MSVRPHEVLLILLPGLPLAAFAAPAVPAWFGRRWSERRVSAVTVGAFAGAAAAAAVLGGLLACRGGGRLTASAGTWFGGLHLVLVADRLSLPFAGLTALTGCLIAVFSRRYLHKEPGHLRFHLLLALFVAGAELLVLADALEFVFAGWELTGLSSALLIAFFHERRAPAEHGLRAFWTYRVCDAGLLGAIVWLHHATGTTALSDPAAGTPGAIVPGILLLWAALGKAAQAPLGGWLPRAMEGPTPSSALCYGAISVSLGPYLLLRTEHLWQSSAQVRAAIIVVGALSAVHAALTERVQTDIKSALAYASMTQVSLVMVEIGAGLRHLALVHLIAHAMLRCAQILRAPSLIHDHHRLERAAHRRADTLGLERFLPPRARRWLYRYSLERGYFDAWLTDYAAGGFLRLLRRLDRLDEHWARRLGAGSGARPAAHSADTRQAVPAGRTAGEEAGKP